MFLKRTIYQSVNLNINIFRDLHPKYSFLRLSPPAVNVDVHKVSSAFWTKFASNTNDKHDLLEAWNLLVTDPNILEDGLKEEIILNLCQSFKDCSYGQLSDILFNLKILYANPELLKVFSQQLDNSLTDKMKEALSDSPTQEDIDQCLKVAFLWLRAEMESHQFHLTRELQESRQNVSSSVRLKGRHNSTLVNLLLKKNIEALTAEQLLFSLFLCGVHRQYPGHSHNHNTGQGFPLPSHLHDKLCHVLPEMTDREVGVLGDSLHRAFIYLETKHATVRQAALHRLVNYNDNLIMRDQFTICSLAKFLKKRGSVNHKHALQVMRKYEPHLVNFNVHTIMRLIHFVLSGKPTLAESRSFTETVCKAASLKMDKMRLKDLEMLAFAIYFLNHKDLWQEMSVKIAEAMANCDWSSVKSGRNFVYATMFLASMEHFDIDSFNKILSSANKCIMDELSSDEGLAEATKFLFDLNIPFERNVSQHYVMRHIPTSRLLYRNSLFCVLTLDCLREIWNLDCQPLQTPLRTKLTNYFHSLQQFEFYSSIEQYSRNDGNISCTSKDSFNVSTKAFIHRDLSIIAGGEDFIWTGHPFPHSSSSVFILIKDKNGVLCKVPKDFTTYTDGHILSRKEDDLDYLAIIVPSKSELDFYGNPFGPVASKMSQLKHLGYDPLIIFWAQYFKELKQKKNLNFLRKQIFQKKSNRR